MKWGEYSSDVQFVLQRSDPKQLTPTPPTLQQPLPQPHIPKQNQRDQRQSLSPSAPGTIPAVHILDRNKESRKSFG